MILVFREFRSRVGDEARVLTALRNRAAAMIRNGRVETVLVCQRADLPQYLLWIQHHAGASLPAVDGEQSLPPLESDLLESSGGSVRMEFVDGAYRFPLPACRVWGVETRDEKVGRALLNLSRLAASDGRIGGVSVYRMAEDPLQMIGFLALAPEVAPGAYLEPAGERCDADLTLYPLRVNWTIGRLAPGAMPSVVRYPRAAFWARLGPVAPAPITPERMVETSSTRRS